MVRREPAHRIWLRLVVLLLFTFHFSLSYALHIECVGTAVQKVEGKDTVFIFAGEPHLRSKVGNVDWYRTSDKQLIQSNTDEIYPESGEGVMVKKDGQLLDLVYVLDYSEYVPQFDAVEVTPRCRETIVQLKGTIPAMTYVDSLGLTTTLTRHCTVSYTNLSWSGENWSDSAASQSFQLTLNKMHLPAVYGSTTFAVRYDSDLREELNLPADSVVSDLMEPVAVTSHVVSTTTIRGEAGQKSNEVERPTEASALSGSGPLDIYFESHPSPAVQFYDWRVYRGSQLLVTRNDENFRYTFSNQGKYRVVGYVLGFACPCQDDTDSDCERDSTQIDISISESQLLVPNVFTPNGDGQNDEFRVLYRSIREYHIWVYNRWGKLVYESTDPAKGWDGMIGNRPAAEGAYYYVIRALGTDADPNAGYHSRQAYEKGKLNGDESYIGIYQLSGDINLLRGQNK